MLDFRSRKRRASPDGGVAHAAKKAAAAVLEAVSPEGSPQKHPVAAFAKNTVRVDPVVKVCGAYGASPGIPLARAGNPERIGPAFPLPPLEGSIDPPLPRASFDR
jgi:hypothetical protein